VKGDMKMQKLQKRKKYTALVACLVATLFVSCVISLSIGVYNIPFLQTVRILFSDIFGLEQTWTNTMYIVIMNVRLPRIIAAVLIGFALAIAGASYQGVFQNPLVSPDILGVSSGATVGAATAIILGLGYYFIIAFAFGGGFVAVLLCVLIPTLTGKKSTLALVLAGIIVGGFLNSVLGLIIYFADPETQLPSIVFWQMGSLSRVGYPSLAIATPAIIICAVLLLLMRWRINALSLSDREAQSLGVNLVRERGLVIIFATILTAVSVSISGTIGWLGLTMPHFARLIVGDDNAKVLPLAGLIGSIFLVVVDMLARNFTGAEIPLGIITGFLGAPLFAFLLIRQRKVV
jgi:iron complex transport system permease protein